MEFLWHVFNKNSWDVVGARCFVAREEAEGFVKNGGVSLPMIMCWGGEGVAGMASIQGNAPFGLTLGSGEREPVSIFPAIAITSAGLLVMRPVSGSRSADRC